LYWGRGVLLLLRVWDYVRLLRAGEGRGEREREMMITGDILDVE
jgi:hypothetical protein